MYTVYKTTVCYKMWGILPEGDHALTLYCKYYIVKNNIILCNYIHQHIIANNNIWISVHCHHHGFFECGILFSTTAYIKLDWIRYNFLQVWLDIDKQRVIVGGRPHSGEVKKLPKMHHCPHCSFSSKNNCHFVEHCRIHTGEKPYSCSLCLYRTGDKSNLKKHVRTHSKERPYLCPYCPYQSLRNSDLRRHMLTHM